MSIIGSKLYLAVGRIVGSGQIIGVPMATCDNTLVWRLLLASVSEHLPPSMISSSKVGGFFLNPDQKPNLTSTFTSLLSPSQK
ncbi:hypothetical protein F2Q69_00024824 [Brassica cretica]|uniref:Uncharacterized protein n=1 Tax=Brassica cretica TaxID=69181 RepID=A0A8S9QIM8_BRACR|nr:hypothetical protein F2Q69_00024824 [Brassica cretica]